MKKINLISGIFSIYTFIISIAIFPYYTNGDQYYYRLAYDEIQKMSFLGGFEYYSNLLGTKEPTYFLISKYLSPIFEKDILMSFMNGIFAFLLTRFLIKRKTNIFVILLIFSNFYLYVIFFAAERLKLSLLIALIPIALDFKSKSYFQLLSILTHIQIILLSMGNTISEKILLRQKNSPVKFFGVLKNIFIISLFAILIYFLWDHIIGKFFAYSTEGSRPYEIGIQATLKPIIFYILSAFYCTEKKIKPLLEHLPIIVASYFIGSERIVIFSYIIFMNYATKINNGLNFGTLITSIYFLIKNYLFIHNIINFNNGFHGS